MKITTSQLKNLIKREVYNILNEQKGKKKYGDDIEAYTPEEFEDEFGHKPSEDILRRMKQYQKNVEILNKKYPKGSTVIYTAREDSNIPGLKQKKGKKYKATVITAHEGNQLEVKIHGQSTSTIKPIEYITKI